MFGYLRVQKSELLVREYEAYKAVYCGLCKQLGKDYSLLTRLALSYDCTFYAMLLMSLERSCKGFDKGRCRFNPLKKCKYAHCADESYSKASALTVISAYYKLKDDLSDSGFFKRLAVRLIKPFFGRWIYLIDAADDLEKDIKKNNFNPFKNTDVEDIKEFQTALLNQSLARAYDAYNLITIVDFKGIFDNMMLYGFPAKQNTVVYRLEEEKNEQSI